MQHSLERKTGRKKNTSNAGRPTLYSEDLVNKLESVFKIGGTVEQAITYAGISKETYYNWVDRYPVFLTKMEQARSYPDIVAKNIVVDSMIKDRDLTTAKWWLEKREFKNTNQINTQVNINSQPITEITNDVLRDDSPEENKELTEEN